MDLIEIGWESVDLIGLAQERDRGGGGDLVKTIMKFRVP